MTDCLVGCQYIPSVEYFARWLHHGKIFIEGHEHFQKRSWRNKTAILGQHGPLLLSVPLTKGKHHEMPIQEVTISYGQDWSRVHLNSIRTAYGKTAFFDEAEPLLQTIYDSKPETLWNLNIMLLDSVKRLLPGDWPYEITSTYDDWTGYLKSDFRKGIASGISSIPPDKIPVYAQVQRLKKSHLSNLCILDALCHLGPGSTEYLYRYANQLYATES